MESAKLHSHITLKLQNMKTASSPKVYLLKIYVNVICYDIANNFMFLNAGFETNVVV